MFGVMIQLYPRNLEDLPPNPVLHAETYLTREEAQAYMDQARRQNLPFKGKWIIEFVDPREGTVA